MNRRVEFLRAWDDGTWDTVVVTVPFDPSGYTAGRTRAYLNEWADEVLAAEPRHLTVVLFGVVNENVQEGES